MNASQGHHRNSGTQKEKIAEMERNRKSSKEAVCLNYKKMEATKGNKLVENDPDNIFE